jgi:endoplasmic reticulum junction formation protein lunapark
LWTLYLAFGYLVYAIVLLLVVGWQNLGAWEWTGLSGSPLVIYLIRTVTNSYFSFRIESLETTLKDYQSERSNTIQKLKDATKYDTTLELLEKYGGERPKHKRNKSNQKEDGQKKEMAKDGGRLGSTPTGRTHMAPPPTANIQRPATSQGIPQNHQRAQGNFIAPNFSPPPQPPPNHPALTAEFAPNAGDLPPSSPQYEFTPGPPRWYDRILDLMLGEDEMAPKNRIVLICQKCRLINGQAPPGTKSLAEIGQWKCMSCHAMNGELDEGKRIMREMFGQRPSDSATDLDEHEDESEVSANESTGPQIIEDDESKKSASKPARKSDRNKSQMIP